MRLRSGFQYRYRIIKVGEESACIDYSFGWNSTKRMNKTLRASAAIKQEPVSECDSTSTVPFPWRKRKRCRQLPMDTESSDSARGTNTPSSTDTDEEKEVSCSDSFTTERLTAIRNGKITKCKYVLRKTRFSNGTKKWIGTRVPIPFTDASSDESNQEDIDSFVCSPVSSVSLSQYLSPYPVEAGDALVHPIQSSHSQIVEHSLSQYVSPYPLEGADFFVHPIQSSHSQVVEHFCTSNPTTVIAFAGSRFDNQPPESSGNRSTPVSVGSRSPSIYSSEDEQTFPLDLSTRTSPRSPSPGAGTNCICHFLPLAVAQQVIANPYPPRDPRKRFLQTLS